MPRSRASDAEAKATGSPSSSIAPEVGFTTPDRIFIRVDLPAPLPPIRAWTSPRRIENEACRSTGMPLKPFSMPRIARMSPCAMGRDPPLDPFTS